MLPFGGFEVMVAVRSLSKWMNMTRRLRAEVKSSAFEAKPLAGRSYPSWSKSLASSVKPSARESFVAMANRVPKRTRMARKINQAAM